MERLIEGIGERLCAFRLDSFLTVLHIMECHLKGKTAKETVIMNKINKIGYFFNEYSLLPRV